MAAFATMEEAEARAKAKMTDKTWIVAHSERTYTGAIAVRVIRPMPPFTNGGWVDITDNAVT
jgi:hypothetical protein